MTDPRTDPHGAGDGPDDGQLVDDTGAASFPGSDPPSFWAGVDDPLGKADRIAESHQPAHPAADPTVTELLLAQQERINSQLDEVASSPRDHRQAALDDFLRVLQQHESTGQAIVHPAIGRIRSDIAQARSAEEDLIYQQAHDLEQFTEDEPAFAEHLKAFRTLLDEHFAAETDSEMPLLDQAFTATELKALGDVITEADSQPPA